VPSKPRRPESSCASALIPLLALATNVSGNPGVTFSDFAETPAAFASTEAAAALGAPPFSTICAPSKAASNSSVVGMGVAGAGGATEDEEALLDEASLDAIEDSIEDGGVDDTSEADEDASGADEEGAAEEEAGSVIEAEALLAIAEGAAASEEEAEDASTDEDISTEAELGSLDELIAVLDASLAAELDAAITGIRATFQSTPTAAFAAAPSASLAGVPVSSQ